MKLPKELTIVNGPSKYDLIILALAEGQPIYFKFAESEGKQFEKNGFRITSLSFCSRDRIVARFDTMFPTGERSSVGVEGEIDLNSRKGRLATGAVIDELEGPKTRLSFRE